MDQPYAPTVIAPVPVPPGHAQAGPVSPATLEIVTGESALRVGPHQPRAAADRPRRGERSRPV